MQIFTSTIGNLQTIPLRLYTLPYWSKNSGSDQYGAEPFEQQQSGRAGAEGVNKFMFYDQY